jgi:peptidyl-prolyl cis-trans isomerase D
MPLLFIQGRYMPKDTPQKIVTKKTMARLERENLQKRYIRIAAIIVLVLVLGIIGFGVLDQAVLRYNRTVAAVDGQKITVKDFQLKHTFTRWQLVQQYQNTAQIIGMFGDNPQFAQQFKSNLQQINTQLSQENAGILAAQSIDSLVDDKIIEIETAKRGITVIDQEVDQELQNAFGFFPNGTPTPTSTVLPLATSTLSPTQYALVSPTPTATQPAVTATPTVQPTSTPTIDPNAPTTTPTVTATPYTVDGFKNQVKTYVDQISKYGFTEKDLRNLIYHDLLRKKLTEQLSADIKPEQEYIWARHILVTDQTVAQSVYDSVKGGKDWTKAASEASQDTVNKDNGGDLGWFTHGDISLKPFEDAAYALNIGEISQPVKADDGWHIIQLLGRETRTVPAAKLQQMQAAKVNDLLTGIRTSDRVKKYNNWQDFIPMEPTVPPELEQLAN